VSMDTAPTAPGTTRARAVAAPRPSRLLLVDLVRAEWTKLWSVRSTGWTLLCTAGAMVSLAVVFAATGPAAPSDPAAYGLSGFFQAQLGAAAVGVLAITPEYATGSIHATFTAAPQRIAVLGAKTLVVAATAGVVGLVSALVAFLVAAQVFAGRGIAVALTDGGAPRTVIGAGLYLALLAVLALALGALVRSGIAAIAVVVTLMLVLPGIVGALPGAWQTAAVRYLPAEAGQAVIGRTRFAPPARTSSPRGRGSACSARTRRSHSSPPPSRWTAATAADAYGSSRISRCSAAER
jgi:ABC-2 type transport system permease protein